MESVDPAVCRRTKQLLLAALEVSPGQRGAILAACGSDQALGAEIRPFSARFQALVKAADRL